MALETQATVALPVLQHDALFAFWRHRATRYALRSVVVVPFTSAGGERGVLVAYARTPVFFSTALIQLMEELARAERLTAIGLLTGSTATDDLHSLDETWRIFVAALDATAGQVDRQLRSPA